MPDISLKTRKRFGQHFLRDCNTIVRIHDVLAIEPEHRILEIGPGRGELTSGILQVTNNVVAIEVDRDLTSFLRTRFPKLEVVQADVLEVDSSLYHARRIIGNLPYNISTPLLLRLATAVDCIDIHLMLQKEVVNRLVADPGTKAWGRLSVKIQQYFDVIPLFDVNPKAFEPPPKVVSSFIRLTKQRAPKLAQNPVLFDAIVRQAFSQRRKTIANSLVSYRIDWEQVGINVTKRADQLTVAEFVRITDASGVVA